MLTAWYIGDHKKDGLAARLGYKIIRFGQTRQRFGNVTHCEAILSLGATGVHTIASASLRDGGVRIKSVDLDPNHWIILDVPHWNVINSTAWFEGSQGTGYSVIGAASSTSLFVNMVLNLFGVNPLSIGQWCSRALGDSVGVIGAEDMSVSELMALAWNIPSTKDVTEEFFKPGAASV